MTVEQPNRVRGEPGNSEAEVAEAIALIWARVEPLRRERGLSMERLAAVSGVTTATLSEMRRGLRRDLRLSTILKLCSGLGVGSPELLGDLPLPEPPRAEWARWEWDK
jgi:transcriptional regulator with XRE-family HTH domain